MSARLSSRGVRALVGLALLTVVALSSGVFLAGCEGELPVPGQNPGATGTPGSVTQPLSVQLATQVTATWAEAIQKLVPLLEGTPPISNVQEPVAQLKEEYLQKMVALGRQIAELDTADQQTVYARTTDILDGTANAPWFQSYVRLYDEYAAIEDQASQDFAVLLSTFNTLTRYAFFDLLKAEMPEEAERLGID